MDRYYREWNATVHRGIYDILAQEVDGDLEFIPITDDGILRLDVFEVLLRLHPKLVARDRPLRAAGHRAQRGRTPTRSSPQRLDGWGCRRTSDPQT